MKQYELENKYVLFERDETTGEERIIGTGDDGDKHEKFYSRSNDESDLYTLYIPRDDGTVFVIEGVTWFDADYEDEGKKLAAYICDSELIYLSFISFFKVDNEYFFEIEPGRYRIFNVGLYYTKEETEQLFYS